MIDVRNLGCPEPVIKTKKALDALDTEGILEVLGNTEASKENILRFAQNSGYGASLEERAGGEFLITLTKGYECTLASSKPSKESGGEKVMFVKDDCIGERSELGEKLARGFLKALLEANTLPKKIIFVNRGVWLTTKEENRATIDDLILLEKKGVEIYSCGACLDYFGLAQELKVGKIGNALETINTLLDSSGVISL